MILWKFHHQQEMGADEIKKVLHSFSISCYKICYNSPLPTLNWYFTNNDLILGGLGFRFLHKRGKKKMVVGRILYFAR